MSKYYNIEEMESSTRAIKAAVDKLRDATMDFLQMIYDEARYFSESIPRRAPRASVADILTDCREFLGEKTGDYRVRKGYYDDVIRAAIIGDPYHHGDGYPTIE